MNEEVSEQMTEPTEGIVDGFEVGQPPAWPKWIGGIAIGWAGLMLTCSGVLTVYVAFLPSLVEGSLEGAPMPEAMQLGALDWTLLLTGIALLFALLFGGIFCVTRNPLCRVLILLWGVSSIPLSLVNYVRQMDAQASLQKWAEQYPDTPLAQQLTAGGDTGQQVGQIISLVITILLGVIIPAFFIVWFGFIKTKPEHFTGAAEESVF